MKMKMKFDITSWIIRELSIIQLKHQHKNISNSLFNFIYPFIFRNTSSKSLE